MNINLSIAFLGTIVPDTKTYNNPAFGRSGNLAQIGIVEGLIKESVNIKVLSSQPIPTYPRDKTLFCRKNKIQLNENIQITLMPALNIVVIREIIRGIYSIISLIKWAHKNKKNKRCIIIYNVYSPPLPFIYLAKLITRSKIVSIIYDLGIPPKSLKLGTFRMMIYHVVEYFAKLLIPRLDGRIVINEAIARDYGKSKHSLLVDGGISSNIINRLPKLENKNGKHETIFLCAGSLWSANGIGLILDAMKINRNPNIRLWFAGNGTDLLLIKKASEIDHRIEYKGMLDLDQLFDLYSEADILMNIRLNNNDSNYLFPSKLLEYLTIGKHVLSTKVAHAEREYGNFCTFLQTNSPNDLSEIMNKLEVKEKSELFKLGIRSREFMLNNKTWDIQSKNILKYIINKVV